MKSTWVHPAKLSAEAAMRVLGQPIEREYTLYELLRRPNVSYASLLTLPVADGEVIAGLADPLAAEQVEIQAKYQGYIDRQVDEVAKALDNEQTRLPEAIDYRGIGGLSIELQQKLIRHQPQTIGQASRIQGMTPAAIAILLVHLKRGALDGARRKA